MRRILRIAILLFAAVSVAIVCQARTQPVPDEASAIQIAEKVLLPIYGRKQIESERPFTARLNGNVWMVNGNLPKGRVGGVAEVKIDKRNGRVLRIIHGK